MLPFVQTIVGVTKLYQSFDDNQKMIFDKLVTHTGAKWLGTRANVAPELLDLVSSDVGFEEKVALVMQNPSIVQDMLDSPGNDSDNQFLVKCPHCEQLFLKEINHG